MFIPFRKIIDFIARLMISAVFILAVPAKITNYDIYLNSIHNKGFSLLQSQILLIAAIVFVFLGSILLIDGRKQRLGITLLLSFLVPTTFIYHFNPFETSSFLMNIGLTGGLIITLIRSPSFKKNQGDQSIKVLLKDLIDLIKKILK